MRILNVTETYDPFLEFGGPPVKVRALSEAMAKRGHQVTVLTADWGLESRLSLGGNRPNAHRSPFGWRREVNGVRAVYLPTWLKFRATSWNPAVKRYCRARLGNFDVAHIFGVYDLLGPAVADACLSRGIPYVVEPIGMFVPIVRSFWLKRMYHFSLGRAMFSGAGAVVATSAQEASELKLAGISPERIVSRRNGVEMPEALPERGVFRAANQIPGNAKLILFLGRLSAKKSPDLLLRAFAALPEAIADGPSMLAIAGPEHGLSEAELRRLATDLGVAARVRFCGALFGEDKWAAYRDADVFVLPSRNENFGNTAAEAAVAGTPAIVTEGCGIAPLLADVAALVVPHNAAAIARAIERVLTEPGLYQRLSEGCARVAARLDWEEPACAMEVLYKELVGTECWIA